MTQIHSRPGFMPRVTKEGKKAPPPAKLQPDMMPAIHSTAQPGQSKSPLTQVKTDEPALPVDRMKAQAEAAYARNLALAQEAARKAGPQIIENPKPSATPVMTSPHK
jgi:hypothetical protein